MILGEDRPTWLRFVMLVAKTLAAKQLFPLHVTVIDPKLYNFDLLSIPGGQANAHYVTLPLAKAGRSTSEGGSRRQS